MSWRRGAGRAAVWSIAAAGFGWLFVLAGRWSVSPIVWSDVHGWLRRVETLDAFFEIARLVGLVLSAYVAFVSLMICASFLAEGVRLVSLSRLLRRLGGLLAVPTIRRRLLETTTAVAITVSSTAASVGGIAAGAAPPAAVTVYDTETADAHGAWLSNDVVAIGFGLDRPVEHVDQITSRATAPSRVVVDGDTLWALIEEHYGWVDADVVAKVAAANALDDPSLVFPGQRLEFPAELGVRSPPVAVGSASWHVHTVSRGDTLWEILHDHYGAVDAELVWGVAVANSLDDPSLIFAGQTITLPPAETARSTAPVAVPSTDEPEVAPDAGTHVPDPQLAAHDQARSGDTAANATSLDPPRADTAEVDPSVGTVAAGVFPPPSAAIDEVDVWAAPPLSPTPPPATTPAEVVNAVPAGAPLIAAPLDTEIDEFDATRALEERAGSSGRRPLEARWLFGTSAVASLGLVGGWTALRRLRRRRRRWLGIEARDDVTAQDVAMRSDDQQRMCDTVEALAGLVEQRPTPSCFGAGVRSVLLGDPVELQFAATAPPPMPGWSKVDGSESWTRPIATGDARAHVAMLSPAVVTIGRTSTSQDRDVLIDLATVGSVSVTGDARTVRELLCSMAWELASQPLGARTTVYLVGVACDAAEEADGRRLSVSLAHACRIAANDQVEPPTVFLVDPAGCADDGWEADLDRLVAACTRAPGVAAVVAGVCDEAVEQVHVYDATRATWRGLTMRPPTLSMVAAQELGSMLSSLRLGYRGHGVAHHGDGHHGATHHAAAEAAPSARAAVFAPVSVDFDRGPEPAEGVVGLPGTGEAGAAIDPGDAAHRDAADITDPEGPRVLLQVCGKVGVLGESVPQATSVLFLLAAANRPMHGHEITELTGYSSKTLSTVFTASHPLVHRDSGSLSLTPDVWTDHGWLAECVRRTAESVSAGNDETIARWLRAGFDGLRSIEFGPYAVLPAQREQRGRPAGSAWGWIDEFPADVPARPAAETELAEAALAYAELWLAIPTAANVVQRDEICDLLGRLAAIVPYAAVGRQVRPSQWSSGAECLLESAVRTANDDHVLLGQLQHAARSMVARELLEASDELADILGL